MQTKHFTILIVILAIIAAGVISFYFLSSNDDGEVDVTTESASSSKTYPILGWDFGNDLMKFTDGQIVGAEQTAQGLELNGIDDYVEIDNSEVLAELSSLGQGSISIWFKVNNIPEEHGIAPILNYGSESMCPDVRDASNQGLIIEVGHAPIRVGAKELYFTIFADGCQDPSFCFDSRVSIEIGEWYHFVAVVGEDYNTGYLNGEEMTDRRYNFGGKLDSQFFEDAVVNEAFWLGKAYWAGQEYYLDGVLGDLRIYDQPLGDDEVKELYDSGR